MKIERNLGSDFGQQDFQKAPAGQTPASPGLQSDQLESLSGLQNETAAAGFANEAAHFDAIAGADLLSGRQVPSFGIAFAKPPETEEASEDSFSAWDIYPLNYLEDAWNWLEGLDLPSVQEAGEWLGDKIVDGFLIAGEAVGDAIAATGGAIGDAAEAVGGAISDAASAVGDAISDALDW